MRSSYLIVLLAFMAAVPPPEAAAAKILGYFGFSSKSHNNFFNALTVELANRGHELTVVTAYPMKETPKNYRQIDAKVAREIFGAHNVVEASTEGFWTRVSKWRESAEFFFICSKTLKIPEVEALKNEKFDLLLVSMFFNDCAYPFAWLNKAPMISLAPTGVATHFELGMGNPEPTSYVPNVFLPFTDQMAHFINFIRFCFFFPAVEEDIKEFFGPDAPSVMEMQKNTSLLIVNGHFSLNYPRPFVPAIIEAGGMQIQKDVKPLPKDLQEFLDSAKDGAIYFSMGSILKAKDMPLDKVNAFVEAFAELPQKVIWKWEAETLPGQPKNVKTGAWLPQQAILGHPNVKLFITHGGLLSTQEASYYGMPLIGIPMMGDQMLNVARSQGMGYALQLPYHDITKESVLSTIKTILSEPSFLKKAKDLQKRVWDQPQTPLERAVFWTEYVLRHNGAPHLRSAAVDLEWYQVHLLDVYAVLAIFAAVPLILIPCIVRKLCCSKSKNQQSTSAVTKDKKKK
ncbi:UDP-glycosyltransferase UGT5-like isoform X2 [Neocloeon triangulifer]|uniref:UDP-glycosyltransferase UGT5-like isoform X2 n=1 Tax=Neocloeon triangulifer TaxID=2078957 RepID=UPI00286F7E8E|nr:UDP-glycosyltransferase UGT5-like isoform X2 [Neocloeon triangulifer]